MCLSVQDSASAHVCHAPRLLRAAEGVQARPAYLKGPTSPPLAGTSGAMLLGGCRPGPIPLTPCKKRPSDPSDLVGLGHTGAVCAAPGLHPLQPSTPGIGLAVDHPEDCPGTMDEQRTEIAVPALGHPEWCCLPTRGM